MTTPTQQPEALRLADEYRPTMPHDVLRLWAKDTVAELRRQHAKIARLTAENEALREKRQPLSDEQKRDALRAIGPVGCAALRPLWPYAKDFAAEIEAAHGIGEKT